MPATDFGWSVAGQQTVCQAVGSKRKHAGQDVGHDSLSGLASKRQCTGLLVGNGGATQLLACKAGSTQFSASCCGAFQQMEMTVPQAHHTMPQHDQQLSHVNPQAGWDGHMTHSPHEAGDHTCLFNNNNNNSSHVMEGVHCREENNNQISDTQSFSQDEMIMDLTDEVYNPACVNFDPLSVTTDAEYEAACSMVAAMEDEGAPDPSQYHTKHGTGGDHAGTPLPGSVACLRKPRLSLDDQPYVSDYY